MGNTCQNPDRHHSVLIVNAADKISTVKEKIQGKIAIKPEFQRLVGNGLEIDDERTLQDYNVCPGQTMSMVYPQGETQLDMEFLVIHATCIHGMDFDDYNDLISYYY